MPGMAAVSGMVGRCAVALSRLQILFQVQDWKIAALIEAGKIVMKARDTRILTRVIGIYLTLAFTASTTATVHGGKR